MNDDKWMMNTEMRTTMNEWQMTIDEGCLKNDD